MSDAVSNSLSIRRAEFRAGLKDIAPQIIATVPFGLVTGVAGVAAGMHPAEAIALSFIAFSGVAQLVATQLFAIQAPLLVALLAVAIVSARLAMYSAALSPYLAHLPRRRRLLMAYLLTDQGFALGVTRYKQQEDSRDAAAVEAVKPHRDAHFFGVAWLGFATWQASVIVGAIVGAQIPSSWSLDFAITLSFLVLIPKALGRRSDLYAALVSAFVVFVAIGLPYRMSLLLATLSGIVVGMVIHYKFEKPEKPLGERT
jgi:predicted branched-subunit amino acid permease